LETTNSSRVNIDNGLLNGVVFIDLKNAFDTLIRLILKNAFDHNILLIILKHYGVDENALTWFHSCLTKRKQKCFVNGNFSDSCPITYGVPQGSIICPLLFLFYIIDLPECLNKGLPRMYADDTNISFQSNTFDELEDLMNIELGKLKEWLNANKLSLNVAKTEFMVLVISEFIGSRQRLASFDDQEINVFVGNDQIERVNISKSLGLKIDENLTWKRHIDEISKKVSAAISALKRIKSYINQDTAAPYCAPVWDGIGSKWSDKLQNLQNRAARVITRSSYDASSSSVLAELGIIYILTVKCKKEFSCIKSRTI
jgi:hypothetical protein